MGESCIAIAYMCTCIVGICRTSNSRVGNAQKLSTKFTREKVNVVLVGWVGLGWETSKFNATVNCVGFLWVTLAAETKGRQFG